MDIQARLVKEDIIGRFKRLDAESEKADIEKRRQMYAKIPFGNILADTTACTTFLTDVFEEFGNLSDYFTRTKNGKPMRRWRSDGFIEAFA